MLLPTHYQLLLMAIKNNPKFSVNSKTLLYNNSELSSNDIESLIRGLFYPDLPCAYFFIKNKQVDMKLRLCAVTNIAGLGKGLESNIKSQLEESHNGRYAINHSMADHPDKTNSDIREAILARCIIIFYVFLVTKDFTFLGYLLHVIQDSFSPVHTYREPVATVNKVDKNIDDIVRAALSVRQITPRIDFSKINHKTVSDLVYHVLDNKSQLAQLLTLIENMDGTTEQTDMKLFANKIIEFMLDACPTDETKIKVANILLGYTDGKIDSGIVNFAKKAVSSVTSTGETVPLNKINPKILSNKKLQPAQLNANKHEVLVGTIYYNDMSHSLRRIYKLIMNSLFNNHILGKLKTMHGGNTVPQRSYVASFLYYPNQEQDKHALKDCGYIELENYRPLFYYAVEDTKVILDMGMQMVSQSSVNLRDAIVTLYNYLAGNTYYVETKFLTQKVSILNKDTQEFKKTNEKFIKCMKENISFATSSFAVKSSKLLADLRSNDSVLLNSKLHADTNASYVQAKAAYKALKNINKN